MHGLFLVWGNSRYLIIDFNLQDPVFTLGCMPLYALRWAVADKSLGQGQ